MPLHKPEKAFKNLDFIGSRDARVMRILAEYLEPQKRLREAGIEDTIVFFGSARTLSPQKAKRNLAIIKSKKGPSKKEVEHAERLVKMSTYYDSARQLAFRLTKWADELESQDRKSNRFTIVTGGGSGMMEAANRGAKEAGGNTLGMNISLPLEQYPNKYIDDDLAFEFHYFFMRKFWLVYMAKAAVIMPGGFGTLDEFMEILTLVQTGKIRRKLPILLFGRDYWSKIVDFEPMVEYGTIISKDLDLFYITDSVDEGFHWLKEQLLEWAVDHPGAGLASEVEKVGKL
jgi:hypothetical protein